MARLRTGTFGMLLAVAGAACDPADLEPAARATEALSWDQQQKLVPSDGADFDFFGTSVAVNGTTALVSSHFDGDNPAQVGACYAFVRSGSTWSEQQKLFPSDPTQFKYFGISVAVDGDSALVGASGDATSRGAVYAFARTGSSWAESQKIVASDGSAAELFGLALALDGDLAVIGAPGDSDQGVFSGGAYVFARSGGVWGLEKKLLPATGVGHGWFGDAVAIDGETVAVGAPADPDTDPALAGAAYAFVRESGSWVEHPLVVSDGFLDDQFGKSIAISGDTIVVGAPGVWDGTTTPGAAYVFVRAAGGGFSLQTKLVASAPQNGGRFGLAVAAGPTRLLVGAPDHDNAAFEDAGATYVFSRNVDQWSEQEQLFPADPGWMDGFGSSLSLFGTTALVGTSLPNDGAAYVFALVGANCSTDTECGTGACSDGFCCSSRCDQSCMDCNLAGSEGECTAVPTGQTDEGCDGTCTGSGECKLRNGVNCAVPSDCESGFCVDGYCCDNECSGVCDSCALQGSEGTCSPKNCSPFVCDPNGDCLTSCSSTADCASGFACNASGQCVAGPAPSADEDSGCGCRLAGRRVDAERLAWVLLALALAFRRRAR